MTGQSEQDSQHGTASIGQPRQGCRDRTARTGQPEKDNQKRKARFARTGRPYKTARQVCQNMSSGRLWALKTSFLWYAAKGGKKCEFASFFRARCFRFFTACIFFALPRSFLALRSRARKKCWRPHFVKVIYNGMLQKKVNKRRS